MGLGGRSDAPDPGQKATGGAMEKSVAAGGAGAGRWCLIESDPGVFTELVEKLGVRGVAFEEVFGLDESSFASIRHRKPLGLQGEKEWEADSGRGGQEEGKASGRALADPQPHKMDVDMQPEEKEEEMQECQQEEQPKDNTADGQQEDGKEGQQRKIFGFIFLFNWSKDKKSSRAAQPNRSPASAAAGAAALARQQKAAKEAAKSGERDKEDGGKAGGGESKTEQGKDAAAATDSGSSSGSSGSGSSVDTYPAGLFFARQVARKSGRQRETKT